MPIEVIRDRTRRMKHSVQEPTLNAAELQPVIDVAVAQTLTGKSHVTVGKALQELELAGILQRLNERRWGRVWECDQLLNLVDEFEKSVRVPAR